MRHTHARLRVQQVGAIITTFNSVPFQLRIVVAAR